MNFDRPQSPILDMLSSTLGSLSGFTQSESWGTSEDIDMVISVSPVSRVSPNSSPTTTTTIYGRSHELDVLLHRFERMLDTKLCQTVRVHGCSGSGKTALVEDFRRMIGDKALFCSGKYFQNSGVQDPYSAIMSAFSDLCEIVSQSRDFNMSRKRQIASDMGTDAHLLKNLISNLSFFLLQVETMSAEDMGINDYETEAAVAKFRTAGKAFLRAMASGTKPVVLFLDDIQWMDDGSKQLIDVYMNDPTLTNVMFVLCYRSEEMDSPILSDVTTHEDAVDISLNNLPVEDVTSMISALLPHSVETLTADLGDLVTQKTNGNPFHVLQFMEWIQREGLLFFDPHSESWVYNVEQIQQDVLVNETVAVLILRKIKLLPKSMQKSLKIASLLGYQFCEMMLYDVESVASQIEGLSTCSSGTISASSSMISSTSEVITVDLDRALELGVVERNPFGFQFAHDKVQSAFRSMLTDLEAKKLHLIIGKTFLAIHAEGNIYPAAVHLNKAIELIQDDNDLLIRLVNINLEAAKYCEERSAFDVAASLLRQGLALLEDNEDADTPVELLFETREALAKMELTVGNLTRCKELTCETISQANSLDMKVSSLLVDVECHMVGKDVRGTIENATSALRELGVKIPSKVSTRHVLMKLVRVRSLLRRKSDQDILRLPFDCDRARTATSKILVDLAFYCLTEDEEMLTIYSSLVALEFTLSNGITPHSASALILYGLVEFNLHDVDRGYRFGKLGMRLMDQFLYPETECMAITLWASVLAHWRESPWELRAPILRAVDSGLLTGEPAYTAFAISNCFSIGLSLGDDLAQLETYMRSIYDKFLDISRDEMSLWAQPVLQSVLNLRSRNVNWKEVTDLTGDIMNEVDFHRRAIASKNKVLVTLARFVKAQNKYSFGFTLEAEELMDHMSKMGREFFNTSTAWTWYLLASLVNYERYRQSGKRKNLRRAHKWQRCLQLYEMRRCPCAVERFSLLLAEEGSVRKSAAPSDVLAAYDNAIALFRSQKISHMEAMANERAGFYLVAKGRGVEARRYLEQAMMIYKNEWHSPAKYEWLKQRTSSLLSHVQKSLPGGPSVVGDVVEVSL